MLDRTKLVALLRGLVLTGCLALLAACGGSDSSAVKSNDQIQAVLPATPTGLAASAGDTSVSLTWTATSAATSYHVKRATTSGGPYTQVAAPTAATYSDASLSNGTTYFYVVSALDSSGESADSAEVSATPEAPTTVPAVPAGLSANPGNAQVSLTWSASSGAISYHVKRATTSGGPYTQIAAPTAAAYSDASLTNGTTYFYVVSALDSAGESADSPEVSATPVAPTTAPAAPAGLKATAGNTQASLSWSSSSGATGYHVKRATTSGGPYTQVGAPSSTSYTDASLTNGTTYYYVVSAINSIGESSNSVEVSAKPVGPTTVTGVTTVPTVPAGLAATAGNAQITLSWSPSSNATSYTLQRATSSGGPYTQVSTPSTTSYTDTALANSTAYFYVVAATDSAGTSANSAEVTATPTAPVVVTPPPVVGSNCGLQLGGAVIFCDTFDAPAGIGNRSGDLNGNVWGVSRDVGNVNIGQGQYNATPATQLLTCNGTTTVRAPNDVIICNGQLHEATNDNPAGVFEGGGVTSLAMYPKQPFDFAGRTGTVAFDVSNDSHGGHATWPEFWMSNLPVPVPFNHFNSLISLPQHGFGVRMAAHTPPGDPGLCPNGNNMDKDRWTVDSAVVVRNYIYEDTNYQGVNFGTPSNPPIKLNLLDCVLSPADGSGVMNHIEVRVTQSEIDIYATDAGVAPSPTSLRKIASITNANLSLTRGLIWLEDVHYNADKGGLPSQREHTFIWDNVAFDGPFTDRDFAYDALDANQPGPAYNAWNTGKYAPTNQTASWNVLNMPANPQATVVRVTFQGTSDGDPVPSTINVIVNGHAHATPWPFPDQQTNTWRTYAVTIPITDLVAGTNVVQLGANSPFITANVDIVLAGVPGGVPVLPGNPTAYPGSSQ